MEDLRLSSNRPSRVIGGIVSAARPVIVEQLATQFGGRVSVLCLPDLRTAENLAEEVLTVSHRLANRERVLEVLALPPPIEHDDEPANSLPSAERALDRAAVLSRLRDRSREDAPAPLLLLTEPGALFAPAPVAAVLDARSIVLATGEAHDLEALAQRLQTELGYDAEAVCEYPGQFAVRGGLLDVYPPNADGPARLDFFGDEIDEIRWFDPTTQRTEAKTARLTLAPRDAPGGREDDQTGAFFGYLDGPVQWIWWEGDEQAAQNRDLFQTYQRIDDKRPHFGRAFDREDGAGDRFVALGELPLRPRFFPDNAPIEEWACESFTSLREGRLPTLGMDRATREEALRQILLGELRARAEAGETVWFLAHNEGEAERLEALVREEAGEPPFPFTVHVGVLASGCRLAPRPHGEIDWLPAHATGFNLVAESDLLGRMATRPDPGKRRRLPQRSQVDHLLDFSELVEGDHLVHLAHGICIFRGLTKLKLGERLDDVISLEFADSITLHLPLHESHLLTRYVGLTKVPPKLGKLGSTHWERARREAEKATIDFAAEMLRLQAVRSHEAGHAFGADTDWQRMFEAAFPYQETPDQHRAIGATKADMMLTRPMDRLVCGDVGFGKTEVAIRAAFKAVMDGKQVAILVPTTVLAQQHYNTFRDRMAEFPVTVDMLSRFRDPADQKRTLAAVRSGGVDILIGTHRLLSHDLKFADLGLLIVDEEHRFGVRHKERVKHLRTQVDVLTMSATPIPRTLYLALMGARDLSTIETAPANRRPIETFVRGYDPELVRKAIRFELERGGQVFYLHNRVQTIQSVAEKLREMVPEARIAVGHGQMDEHQLENVMTSFVAGEQDILVCTTIIENGIDIPNCNTLIIEGADRFGLAQLYQLRGRVGRFNRQAYAYLLLHRHGRVLKVARERLNAMRQYNQLGAGFKIAMRDLELRGAGNLLGARQSGHVASVGFELYCQLLRQSVARLKGEDAAARIRANVKLDIVQIGGPEVDATEAPARSIDAGFGALKEAELADTRVEALPATLPLAYVSETRLRIDIYRRLALAESTAEVDALSDELTDRFGTPPNPTQVLILVTRIRTLAQACGFAHVESEGNRLKIRRASGKRNDFVKIGARFPRLTAKNPLRRLREIEQFLLRNRPKS